MSARHAPGEPSTRRLLFYVLLILCGFLIGGRLDYADAVLAENARLQADLDAERSACAADIEHLDSLDKTATLTRREM